MHLSSFGSNQCSICQIITDLATHPSQLNHSNAWLFTCQNKSGCFPKAPQHDELHYLAERGFKAIHPCNDHSLRYDSFGELCLE